MLYLIFALAALFLTACADPDNPVVYTAPAGKAVADDDDEVKQPPGTNYGSYEEIPYVPADPPETAAQTQGNQVTNSQTSRKLVGNTAQAHNNYYWFEYNDHRQDFTTGPDVRSWKLTAVKIFLKIDATTLPTFTVEIWTTTRYGASDAVDTRIGPLDNPASLTSSGLYEFTGDIDLAASTTYALVVDVEEGEGGSNIHMSQTASLSEDSGSVVGWSIDDPYQKGKSEANTGWTKDAGSAYRIEIHGYAILLPAESQSETIKSQSEIDRHRTSSLPAPGPDDWYKEAWDAGGGGGESPSPSLEREYRHQQLVEAGVLPILSVSGCRKGNNAVFTFNRTGPTTENLLFTFNSVVDVRPPDNDVQRRYSIAFGEDEDTREWNGGALGLVDGVLVDGVAVRIEPGWHGGTGDYRLGTSAVRVG